MPWRDNLGWYYYLTTCCERVSESIWAQLLEAFVRLVGQNTAMCLVAMMSRAGMGALGPGPRGGRVYMVRSVEPPSLLSPSSSHLASLLLRLPVLFTQRSRYCLRLWFAGILVLCIATFTCNLTWPRLTSLTYL